MTTIRILGHIVGLVARDRIIGLDRRLGMLPMSPYWRGYHDAREELAAKYQLAADGCVSVDGRRAYKDCSDIALGREDV